MRQDDVQVAMHSPFLLRSDTSHAVELVQDSLQASQDVPV